jgi:hypothetical protein
MEENPNGGREKDSARWTNPHQVLYNQVLERLRQYGDAVRVEDDDVVLNESNYQQMLEAARAAGVESPAHVYFCPTGTEGTVATLYQAPIPYFNRPAGAHVPVDCLVVIVNPKSIYRDDTATFVLVGRLSRYEDDEEALKKLRHVWTDNPRTDRPLFFLKDCRRIHLDKEKWKGILGRLQGGVLKKRNDENADLFRVLEYVCSERFVCSS